MLLSGIFKSSGERKVARLNGLLHQAIFRHDAVDVATLLGEGADPNVFASPADRYRPLSYAIEWAAPFQVIDALLNAGADPQEPYRWQGRDYRLSEIAEMGGLQKEILERLKSAEREADNKYGPRPLSKDYQECPTLPQDARRNS